MSQIIIYKEINNQKYLHYSNEKINHTQRVSRIPKEGMNPC